jgi:pimeloyl-ACP methyl ester carboxylesterase
MAAALSQGPTIVSILFFLALASFAPAAPAQASHSVTEKAGITRSIEVPFSRRDRSLGTFPLEFELGKPFDAAKPAVFVIPDGQQFYVRQGTVAPLQDEIFGDGFNVIGIIGRGSSRAVEEKIHADGKIDWQRAYAVLCADEWIDDIEAVRIAVVGRGGKISLYGRSGGGLLVDQYLAKYPAHVRTVFTQAAVNRFVDAKFGIQSDRFWDEIFYDRSLQPLLLGALSAHPDERERIMLLLQRQNFFVPAADLQKARADLIHALADWNEDVIHDLSAKYQVDAIMKMDGPAGAVRVFELFAPVLGANGARPVEDRVDPDLEIGRTFGAPLFALLAARKIEAPAMDLNALGRVKASVVMLAGRYDHTADYRSQSKLSKMFLNHLLILLNDNHDFTVLSGIGLYEALVQAALVGGVGSDSLRNVEYFLRFLESSQP